MLQELMLKKKKTTTFFFGGGASVKDPGDLRRELGGWSGAPSTIPQGLTTLAGAEPVLDTA